MLTTTYKLSRLCFTGGSGFGTATITGSGTVWPAALGGLISFVSSGTVTGSGRVEGCGTMVCSSSPL